MEIKLLKGRTSEINLLKGRREIKYLRLMKRKKNKLLKRKKGHERFKMGKGEIKEPKGKQ